MSILDLSWWYDERYRWRSWVAHFSISLAVSLVGHWTWGGFYYVQREGGQVINQFKMTRWTQDWLDHFMDIATPITASLLAYTLKG